TSGQQRPDEMSPLLAGFPRVPRGAVFERNGKGAIVYTRAGTALPLDEMTSRLFLRCDGERSLGQVLGDAGYAALEALLRLARAGVAAPHQVLSLGLSMELPDARVETNIARVQQAESYRAVVVNEIGAQLGFSNGKNSGLIRLVADAAGALAPGGVLIVADYGDPKA